jgi:hypothetical protein
MSNDNKPTTLMIDNVKYVREDSILNSVPVKPGQSMYQIGAHLFVQTVTFFYTGRLTFVNENEIILEDVALVADTGRFTQAVKEGKLNEVEIFPEGVSINRGSIVAVSPWKHKLPQEQK